MTPYSILTTLFFFCLCCFIVSHSHSLNNGFTIELIHRDSSKSPLYNPTETQLQRLTNAIHRSINYSQIQRKGEYLMKYSVGTPPFKVYGIVDTGSDLVWLQCKPCDICFNQTSPVFYPSKSSTYRTLPCNSNVCQSSQSVHLTHCDSDNNCQYSIQYDDHSVSQGDLSVDTLTLDPTNGPRVAFPKTVIGCGRKNIVSFKGQISSIVGLGNSPVSLSSQIGGKFSYCLVPLSNKNVTSSINFGDSALVSGKGAVSVPLFQSQGLTTSNLYYRLTLEGFSVGNEKIELGSNGGFSKGNIVMDTGTTLTLLPIDLLSRLEAAVAKVVNHERVQDPTQQLSLCYKISSEENLHVPVITTHFSGVDVVLNSLNTFIPVEEEIVCFAFAATPGGLVSVFGSVAQQNLLVGYDLQKKTVSFKPTDCTKKY